MDILHFASPWFLLGLISLVIPFLLLLTRANPRHTVSFSSLEFLSSITKNASTVIEWKRILLLIVRLMLLTLLALAFALPFVKKGGEWISRKGNHHIFVLDNSYGMGYSDSGDLPLFEQAKKKISETVNEKPRGMYSLYVFNNKLEPVVLRNGNPSAFLKTLENVSVSSYASDFSALVAELEKITQKENKKRADIFLLSDFSIPDAEKAKAVQAGISELKRNFRIEILPIQPKHYKNLAVQDIQLPFYPFVPGAPDIVRVTYTAYGYKPGEEIELRLSGEKIEAISQKMFVPASLSGEAVFKVTFPFAGQFTLRADSGADGLSADNTRYAVVNAHPPLNLLFLQDSSYDYPFDNPNFYFNRALQSFSSNDAAQWVNMANASLNDLMSFQLDHYEFIVIADMPNIGAKNLTQLKYYMKEGGSLLFAPGKSFSSPDLQESHAKESLGQFLGGQFGDLIEKKPNEPPFHLTPVDYSNPLFKIYDHGRQGDLGRISFWKIVPFMPIQGRGDDENLLWFDSKWPALVHRKIGEGNLFIWTSSLNHAWTDFPKDPLYVPFIFELLKYASLRDWNTGTPLRVGEPILFEGTAPQSDQILIRDPKGEQITLYADAKSPLRTFPARFEGFYEWTSVSRDGQVRKIAACNVDTLESRPGYLRWELKPETPADEAAALAAPETGVVRRFLYLFLFYAIFILLLIEAWMSNRMYKPQWV